MTESPSGVMNLEEFLLRPDFSLFLGILFLIGVLHSEKTEVTDDGNFGSRCRSWPVHIAKDVCFDCWVVVQTI